MANFDGMNVTFNPNFNASYKEQPQPDTPPSGGTGADGKSAYEIAVQNGFEGSEAEWLDSLQGEDGKGIDGAVISPDGELIVLYTDGTVDNLGVIVGSDGEDGHTPEKGKDFFTAEDIEAIATAAAQKITVSNARIGYVTLLADAWNGTESPYSQIVNIDGVTDRTQVDLTPNVEQLAIFYNKDLTFVTENNNGVVTVYAIGQKTQNDYTIQATLTEVKR